MAKRPNRDLAALSAALLGSALAFLPLIWGRGIVNTRAGGDSPFLIVRLQQLVTVLSDGSFPPRWMPDAAYGLGYPFFNFYASLPYYLGALFKFGGLGYLRAIQATQAFGFLAAALAMYALARKLFASRAIAIMSALAYTYAPFHLVNVYVRGDSLSEFYAFVFYPLIFWALLKLRESLSLPHLALLSLSYAGLILAHNVSALIFSPFIGLYILGAFLAERQERWRWLLFSSIGVIGGLILSCWFWWPALGEKELGHMADMTTGYFNYSGHFRGLELIQPRLFFDYSITQDRTPFVMGGFQAVVAVVGLVAALAIHPRRWLSWLAIATLALSTFLITPLSKPLWDHLPLLPLVQFPWRFLSIQAFAIALLSAEIGRWPQTRLWRIAISLILCCLFALLALGELRPERLDIQEQDVSAENLALYELFTGNIGSTVRYEYLPRWVDTRPFTSSQLALGQAAPLLVEGQVARAELTEKRATRQVWEVEVASPSAALAFPTYYFPGWAARIDNLPAPISPLSGLGYIQARIPQGQHQITLRFGRTPTRTLAEMISLTGLLALLYVLATDMLSNPKKRKWIKWASLALLVTTGVIWGGARVASVYPQPANAATSPSDLTMDFDRQPYLHHNLEGVSFSDRVRLQSYQLASREMKAGETIDLSLQWRQTVARSLEVAALLVSLDEPLFNTDDPLAVARVSLAETTQHGLKIPEGTAPGHYLISVRVWDQGQEIMPVNVLGETLGTTYLQPIHILSEPGSGIQAEKPASAGDCIALTEAHAAQNQPTELAVRLLWKANCAITRNYAVSIRLQDRNSRKLASLDTQAHYGLYPTSLWRTGESIADRYRLALPEGLPPGQDYGLEIILYDPKTLQAVGQPTIWPVSLTQPVLKPQLTALHRFGELDLVSAELGVKSLEEGQSAMLKTAWVAATKPSQDYRCRISLLGEGNKVIWEGTEPLASGYAATQWPQYAFIAADYELDKIPVGEYRVALTLLDAGGAEYGSFTLATLLTIKPKPREFAMPKMQANLNADLPPMRLLGYDLSVKDKRLDLTLYWQALDKMSSDYKVFVHVFDPAQEKIVAQFDAMPRNNSYPTSGWVKGEIVRDPLSISLAEVSAGSYNIAIGVYDPQNNGRLPVQPNPRITISDQRIILSDPIQLR
jgi:hypothetical protein